MGLTTILLADDHHVVRQGLRALLEAKEGFSVVGEAGSGLEAMRLLESLRPHVLIIDLMMPGLNGLEVARQVSQRFSQTAVIILSMHANEAYVLEALRCGAEGYVLKGSSAEELERAVREVAAGRRYLSSSLSERAIDVYMQKAEVAPVDKYETLTTREREVLHLAAEGYTSTEIGERLSISPRTVQTHRANMMQKLNLNSQTDLIRYALQRGILPLEMDQSE